MQDGAVEPGAAPAETYFDPQAISDRLGAHAPKYDQLAVELAEKRWAWLTEDDGYRGAFHDYLQNILAEYLDEHGESVEYDGSGWIGELHYAVFSRSLDGERCPQLKARARAHAAGEVTRGQGFTREWLYDVILEQMVYVLQVHGPDAPPGAQVDAAEEGEAEAAEESEDDGVLDAADAEDAELTDSLSAASLRDTPFRDTELGRLLAQNLARGTELPAAPSPAPAAPVPAPPASATVPSAVVAGSAAKDCAPDTVSEADTARSAARTHEQGGELGPEPMEQVPVGPASTFAEEVGSQMTADTRAALVQRGLPPTNSGLAEAMMMDALAGASREDTVGGHIEFTPAAGR